MTKRKKMIREIRNLYATKLGQRKGVVVDSYEAMEAGIRTYNFTVLAKDGLHYGYWSGSNPALVERTIAARVVDTGGCEKWNTLDDDELTGWLKYVRHFQGKKPR